MSTPPPDPPVSNPPPAPTEPPRSSTADPVRSSKLVVPSDPHATKIAADDPRLHLDKPRGRTLKKGPALALVLSLAGAILIALVVAMQPAKAPVAAKRPEPEQPVQVQPPTLPDSIRAAPDNSTVTGPPTLPRLGVVPLPDGGVHAGIPSDRPYANASQQPSPDQRARQLELEQEMKARGSGILVELPRSAGTQAAPTASTPPSPPLSLPPGLSAQQPPQPSGLDDDPNMQNRKNSFLDSDGASRLKDYLSSRVRHPRTPYEVKAGTILPAVLITAMNSDLPGPVIGQIRENVYDSVTGNHLLIPQGARLLATYDSMVAWGQERVLVCWNRLIFPNGDSLDLECMPGADLQGAAGLTDDVNEHWARIVKGAAVASLLAATTTAVAGDTQGFSPTVPQTMARNAAANVNKVGQAITSRNLNVQPTITVRPGYSINVMVTKDMIIPPYSAVGQGLSSRSSLPQTQ